MTIAEFEAHEVLDEAREAYPHISFDLGLVKAFISQHGDIQVNGMLGVLSLLTDWLLANNLTDVVP